MKIISSLALVIISFSILGNQEGDNLIMQKLFGFSEREQAKIQDLYLSVEEDLTHLLCEGVVATKFYYSNGFETSIDDVDLFRVSLNDSYLFFKGTGYWWLIAELQNGKWVNKFPEVSNVQIDESSISRHYGFHDKPLGKLDLNKILNLGVNSKVHLEAVVGDLIINRTNGKYHSKGIIGYSYHPKGDDPDFQMESSTNGECNLLPEKRF